MNKRQDVCTNDTSSFNYREAGARPRTQQTRQPGAEDPLTYDQFLILHQARARSAEEEATTFTAGSAGPSNRTRSDCVWLAFRNTEDLPQRMSQPASHSHGLSTEQLGRQGSSQLHNSGRTETVALTSEDMRCGRVPFNRDSRTPQRFNSKYRHVMQSWSKLQVNLKVLLELSSKNVEKNLRISLNTYGRRIMYM